MFAKPSIEQTMLDIRAAAGTAADDARRDALRYPNQPALRDSRLRAAQYFDLIAANDYAAAAKLVGLTARGARVLTEAANRPDIAAWENQRAADVVRRGIEKVNATQGLAPGSPVNLNGRAGVLIGFQTDSSLPLVAWLGDRREFVQGVNDGAIPLLAA